MTDFPVFEPALSTDREGYLRKISFWHKVENTASIRSPADGVVQTLVSEMAMDVDRVSNLLSEFFENIPLDTIEMAIKSLTALKLFRTLYQGMRKKPQNWDSRQDQATVLAFLKDNLGSKDAAKIFKDRADACGEEAPQFLIYHGIQKHLEGFAQLGAKNLELFHKQYRPKNEELYNLLLLRTGKALAGAGEIKWADKRYSELAHRQEGLARAETIRERCNLATQLAWTYRKNPNHQSTLKKLLSDGEKALRQAPHSGLKQRVEKVRVSFREFSTTLGLLGSPSKQWRTHDLEEVRKAVEELSQVDATTGNNRHAHVAVLYLRAGQPEFALKCLHSVREHIESKMEQGLSYLVEGQAYGLLEGRAGSGDQIAAFREAENLFASIPGDRYRRVSRGFCIEVDPDRSRLDALGCWAWSMIGGNRIVGSWVIQLPQVRLIRS